MNNNRDFRKIAQNYEQRFRLQYGLTIIDGLFDPYKGEQNQSERYKREEILFQIQNGERMIKSVVTKSCFLQAKDNIFEEMVKMYAKKVGIRY